MSDHISFLPLHIVEKILLGLDVKTLINCSFVCRDWNSLITSPDFVSRYSNRTSDSKNQVLFLQVCGYNIRRVREVREESYSLHLENDQFDLLRTLERPPIDRFKTRTSSFQVLGTSNGLVCLVDQGQYTFILWNPTVRRYALLPRFFEATLHGRFIGFGFDPRNNDFKVVCLVEREYNLDSAWVFSYATWSWKHLTLSTPPPCDIVKSSSHLLINGVLHWLARHKQKRYNFVLTFDLARGVLGEIFLPQSIATLPRYAFLLPTGDLLAAAEGRAGHIWSVWVMKQYGVHESWTNVVPPHAEDDIIRHVLGVRKNGDMILEMKYDMVEEEPEILDQRRRIFRYNPTTTTAIDNVFEVMGDSVSVSFDHVESLYLFETREEAKCYMY